MKKYLVVGNPIEHSLSPQLHNYWIKKIILKVYMKKLDTVDLKDLILKIKRDEISGANVTIPHKKTIIQYLDDLSPKLKLLNQLTQFFVETAKLLVTILILKVLKRAFKI